MILNLSLFYQLCKVKRMGLFAGCSRIITSNFCYADADGGVQSETKDHQHCELGGRKPAFLLSISNAFYYPCFDIRLAAAFCRFLLLKRKRRISIYSVNIFRVSL